MLKNLNGNMAQKFYSAIILKHASFGEVIISIF